MSDDVFASFQLGEVEDNENKLLEKEIQINKNRSKVPAKDIYKQFRLSDIVKENEQRQRQQQQAKKKNEEQQEEDVTNISANNERNLIWKKIPKKLVKLKQKDESGNYEVRKGVEVAEVSVKSDSSFFAASGTAVAKDTVAAAANASATNPITDVLGSQFYWESPADDVFVDFNLSEIVRDYEKLQRRVKYAPKKDEYDDDDDEEVNRENKYLKTSRYVSAKNWWLDNWPRCHGIIFRVFIPLWILTGMAIGLGYILARFEKDEEYQRNNEMMKSRFLMEQFPYDEALKFLFGLPTGAYPISNSISIVFPKNWYQICFLSPSSVFNSLL
jgi:hypothetical protein